jgi:hypothetical protein
MSGQILFENTRFIPAARVARQFPVVLFVDAKKLVA